MFIASAILIRFYITVCIFQKRITPFVKKNIHIVHSPVGTPEGDIVVDRILSYYIFSTRSYFGYLITCPCSFLQVCITCSKTVFIIIHSVSIDWFNFVSQIG
mgnify:CR=1 FL=1